MNLAQREEKKHKKVIIIKHYDNYEEVFSLKPTNEKYRFYKQVVISAKDWNKYVHLRSQYFDMRNDLRKLFKPIKDKPTWVAKYHNYGS